MQFVQDAFGIAKDQTRTTIAYGLVFAFAVTATYQSLRWGDIQAVAMLKDLALVTVSFYFGSKQNGVKS